jgi:hypothetical protein
MNVNMEIMSFNIDGNSFYNWTNLNMCKLAAILNSPIHVKLLSDGDAPISGMLIPSDILWESAGHAAFSSDVNTPAHMAG